ncbi:hypothetical protein E2P81_ATG01788 [Venturia nashicola]|uniref:Uncharacterized protein n=1 Tax=Venturia nashicola TaxID=86259 RepID=A0A4Z1PCD1_9PEZI|nr:hypothetical protein E6O75_ATG01835 [Venturia nashicola]TLD35485.1 hypothetical protein E2P81_ATG01788 [Venturia nashicola]
MSTSENVKASSYDQPRKPHFVPSPTLFNVFTIHQTKGQFTTPAALFQSGRAEEFQPTEAQTCHQSGTETRGAIQNCSAASGARTCQASEFGTLRAH